MKLESGQVIITPVDSPQYEPDWRYKLARAVIKDPELDMPLIMIQDDPYLEAQLTYMLDANTGRSMLEQCRPTPPAKANVIHDQVAGGDLRQRLQALLLTEADYSEIALDLGLSPTVVRYYERVFFNCRTDQGGLPHSAQLLWFALGGNSRLVGYGRARDHMIWRMVAVTMGYTGVAYSWGLSHTARPTETTRDMMNRCFDAGVGRLISQYAGGTAPLVEVQALFSHYVAYERLQRENEKGHNEAAEALWMLIKALAPKLSEHANVQSLGAAALERQLIDQASNAAAQTAIDGTQIEDKGPVDPNELLNEQIRAKLEPVRTKQKESE